MAEIRVVYKRRSVWPWVVGLVLVAAALFMVSQAVAGADYARRGNAARLVRSHPATVTAARPGKKLAPAPAPTPREATEQEEALRLRSRMMA